MIVKLVFNSWQLRTYTCDRAFKMARRASVAHHEKEQIIRHVRSRFDRCSLNIHFIENPAFANTSNIYSSWLARDWLRGDSFVCLNADVVLKPDILDSALRADAPMSMIVDHAWRDETMKVIISNGRVIRMSKKISQEEFSATYIGITVFDRAIQEKFFRKIHTLIEAGRVNEFFNAAVQELADEGVRVGFTTTAGLPWAEIDDALDLTFAPVRWWLRLWAYQPNASRSRWRETWIYEVHLAYQKTCPSVSRAFIFNLMLMRLT
jgi:choline kinase